ncbi:hypothetical protein ALQ72_01431 [Pseudomonas syringae pv. maculicola]|uniref:hypothetical protein n=1 Tax=Pseudomonas TaxID=286 RepID=UPI0006B93E4D|nr:MULTISPECIES: hypothetical protein [Pseudomonas]MBX8518728.1 hypothetical protein [Pseudomonas cichorii]KPB98190.1 Uncharacterized protein AC503_5741 [Pseudomonas syringae pv. maculicola]MBD8602499.1 hypothetical protein [Pseudomonas sp. CFBP 8771]MBM0212921.1 hypothetical protein [Pseudomonas syringae pv. maculicola]QQN24943.1 hypothetical protein JHZ65_14525 [Pseudomonas syringae pv. maculicola]
MTDFVKTAAFAAKTSLALKGIKVQHGIALEVVAAFLGYKTYAALVVEENREDMQYHLADAEIIVLNYSGGLARLTELGVLQASIVQDFIDALVNCRDGVFSDLPDFLDDYIQQELRNVILSDESVVAAVDRATGSEPFSVELDERKSFSEPLWGASDTWEVSGFGTVRGLDDRADADDENHEGEEAIHCFGWVKFSKAGRAGLKLQRSGGEFVER